MNPPVVVTGASGFLGAAVVAELARRGANIIAVSRQAPPHRPGVAVVRLGDYHDTPAPSGAILIHLAEESAADVVSDTNGSQATQLMGALLAKGYGRAIYASSAVVYGEGERRPRLPTDITAGSGPYVVTKLACEALVLNTPNGVVARLANIFGPGMTTGTVVDDILSQLAEEGGPGRAPLIVQDPAPVRDFLWIEDAAAGLADMALGESVGIFNLGSGVGWSIGQLAATASRLAGQERRGVVAGSAREGRSHLVLNIAETKAAFGWRPRVSVEDGLRRMVAHQ